MNRTNLVEDFTLMAVPPWWQSPLAIVAMGVLALSFGALVRWAWLKCRRRTPVVPLAAPLPDRHAEFLARLEKLRSERAHLDGYALAIAASELEREYVEWRFRLQIRFQTTREFLEAAAVHEALESEQRSRLGDFLKFCDRMKFARASASPGEVDGLLDSAERFIRSGQAKAAGSERADGGAA